MKMQANCNATMDKSHVDVHRIVEDNARLIEPSVGQECIVLCTCVCEKGEIFFLTQVGKISTPN